MNLYKTSFWSAFYSAFKLVAGLIITKIMAVVLGPNGVAQYGMFTNISGILSVFSNGATSSGVIKYVAEYQSDEDKRQIVSNALIINFLCSFFIGAVILLGHKQLAIWTFGIHSYDSIFVFLGFGIIFFGLNLSILAILNGYRMIKSIVVIGMLNSLISVVLAIVITLNFGLYGAAINTVIAQVLIFFVNITFISNKNIIIWKSILNSFNIKIIKRLLSFSLLGIITVIATPLCTMLIRKYISVKFSIDDAGHLQGVWDVSNAYLYIITTALSVYYLPTLSSISADSDLRKELIKGYKLIVPVVLLIGIIVLLLRDFIILTLYTSEFIPMKELFVFQIVGDLFKMMVFLLGYLNIAKAMIKRSISIELMFSASYLLLVYVMSEHYGVIGVTYAYALNYLLCFLYLLFLYRKLLFRKGR